MLVIQNKIKVRAFCGR